MEAEADSPWERGQAGPGGALGEGSNHGERIGEGGGKHLGDGGHTEMGWGAGWGRC